VLIDADHWVSIAEVNPPQLPDLSHRELAGVWSHVLITDNVMGKIRVSPYAFGARITHDVPSVHPTVVVSTRDRNILAIESEVRGALGNGIDSFFVVIGDTVPAVDHLANHYEIVEHLRSLQDHTPVFEVGMPTRFREWQFRKRIELGAQFFIAGPVIDAATVIPQTKALGLRDGDPPVYLALIPPFSVPWVERAEQLGTVPATAELKAAIAATPPERQRSFGWDHAGLIADRARESGYAGVVLMGLKYSTLVDGGAIEWQERAGGRR
jgi:5,10-methylenetetrahydrofolate reductase